MKKVQKSADDSRIVPLAAQHIASSDSPPSERNRNSLADVQLTPKMRAARDALKRHFHRGFAKQQECFALLDVLRVTCDDDPTAALMELDFLHSEEKHRLNRKTPDEFLPYKYVHWFCGTRSVSRLCVDSHRQAGWLAPFRVTMYADDTTGLLAEHVLGTLEVMPASRITMLELALDFPLTSGVSPDFVRKHGVFGKARPDHSVTHTAVDWWGARRGRKRTKSYTKWEIATQRVESKFLKAFLDVQGISDVFDFHRFAELLPDRHIFFAELSEERLVHRLRENLHYSNGQTRAIVRNVHERENDLYAVLDYLRRDVGLTNVRRLLVARPENQLVREALQAWAAKWPTRARRLK